MDKFLRPLSKRQDIVYAHKYIAKNLFFVLLSINIDFADTKMAAILITNSTQITKKLNILRTLDFSIFGAEKLLLETDVLKRNQGEDSRNLLRKESRDIMTDLKKYIREMQEYIVTNKPTARMEILPILETWITSLKVQIPNQ